MSIFNFNSPLMQFLGKVWNVMVISLFWTICSIPVITIGAATTALYHVTLKIVRNDDDPIVRSFMSAFVDNFKQSTKAWLLMLLLLLVLGGSAYIYIYVLPIAGPIKIILFCIELLFLYNWIAVCVYLFPLIARFENTLKQTFYNAFILSGANLGYTVAMLVVNAVVIYLSMTYLPIIGVGISAWYNSYFFQKIFNKTFALQESHSEENTEVTQS